MITTDYCRTMARYNAWQNRGLRKMVEAMPLADLTKERGAFFGSIFATLNHVLWADQLWLGHLAGHAAPTGDHLTLTPTAAVWSAERFRTDGRITLWAEGLRNIDLAGNVTWFSKSINAEVTKAKTTCIAHFFNHQTHHRGQIHAMLTAAGQKPGPTDLVFMPED